MTFHPPAVIFTLSAALAGLCVSAGLAASTVYTDRDANGGIVFSDAPLVKGQLSRTSYQAEYGRPAASASCHNLAPDEMANRARTHEQTIDTAAKTHQLDPALIMAIVEVESCFDRKAVSRVGAQGIMQLMPATAKELGVSDSFNARQNIDGGVRYLAQMLSRFNQDHELALAAYNAGPGAVQKYQGVPPYPETQHYVKKVLGIYARRRE